MTGRPKATDEDIKEALEKKFGKKKDAEESPAQKKQTT